MHKFRQRSVVRYELPISNKQQVLVPEFALLTFGVGLNVDVGALCYLRRSGKIRWSGNKGSFVDLSSLNCDRAEQVRHLVEIISDRFAHSGLRSSTLYQSAHHFVRFIDWCDNENFGSVLCDATSAKAALTGYLSYLRERIDRHELKSVTAASRQSAVIALLEEFLDVENISRGISLIQRDRNSYEPTSMPCNADIEKVMGLCTSLFTGFSSLVIDHKPYPFAINIPSYLGLKNNLLWIFPIDQWCNPSGRNAAGKLSNLAYDSERGEIRSRENVMQEFGGAIGGRDKRDRYDELVRNAKNAIKRANQKRLCVHRKGRGSFAVKIFFYLFIANTGMNPAVACELPWSTELDDVIENPLIERQGFRSIKYRADNRMISFEVGVQFMPLLRRYLQLRKALLGKVNFQYLFMAYSTDLYAKKIDKIPKKIDPRSTGTIFCVFTSRGLIAPKVTPRQLRVAKQDYVLRAAGPVISAGMMQHTLTTANKNYTNGSQVDQEVEISAFLRGVESTVLKNRRVKVGERQSVVGLCTVPDAPNSIEFNSPITPDCIRAEGCFFCDKYRAHVDEIDVRKILSVRYCINKTSYLGSSVEQFKTVFGPVLERIEFILNEIKLRNKKLVIRVEHEVDNDGELDNFWAAKLETLMQLELVR